MKILFRTKEESKIRQRENFLKLIPAQRFEKFLEMMEAFEMFPVNEKIKKSREKKEDRNFVIKIRDSDQ